MAQKTAYACSLAAKLIGELHGELPEAVVRHLLDRGFLTLGEIIRGIDLPPVSIKQALLLLVQHNYVAAYTQRDEEGGKNARPTFVLYQPQASRILQTIRHPKFVLHICDEHGEYAGALLEVLLENGRLRFDELLTGAATKLHKEVEDARVPLQAAFMSLVQGRYVERAPPCTLPPPRVLPHENTRKKRRVKAGTNELAAEQAHALRSYDEVRYEQQRFALPPGLVDLMDADNAASPRNRGEDVEMADVRGDGGATWGTGITGMKRAAAATAAACSAPPVKKARIRAGTAVVREVEGRAGGAGAGAANGGGPTSAPATKDIEAVALLWRVNNDEFNRRFRHEACVEVVASKLDRDAASVLSVMLQLARPYETGVQDQRTSPVSEDDTERRVAALVAEGKLEEPSAEVGTIIRTLAADTLELLTYVGEAAGGYSQYTVNTGRIVDVLRSKQLESVIRDRFDTPGLRIFRLLQLRGHLEQKQISDFGMLPAKHVRQTLYRMLAAGFVELQDIPKTNDRAASRTFHVWRMNHDAACTRVGYELYRAAGNAWLRLQHEYRKEQELTEVVRQAVAADGVTLTEAQKKGYRRLNLLGAVMFHTMQRLDSMIAIFNDY